VPLAGDAARTQKGRQLPAQGTASLNMSRLKDRLVADAHGVGALGYRKRHVIGALRAGMGIDDPRGHGRDVGF
jgi:hypothetical protein